MCDPLGLTLPVRTARLTIRLPERKDMRAWSALYRSQVVRKHMKGPLHRSATEWWTRLTQARDDSTKPLSVELSATGDLVGACGFLQELGATNEWEIYCLFRRKYWRQGFGAEVTRTLLDVAFGDLHANRAIGIINPQNATSIRMVQRVGFSPAGSFSKPGSWQHGHLLFVLDRSTYNSL